MVSEYANGRYAWVLSLMFIAWAISSWALAFALAPDELRAKVRQVLSTPSYTENARRISEKMQTIGGIAWTARRIEEFSQGFPRIGTEK